MNKYSKSFLKISSSVEDLQNGKHECDENKTSFNFVATGLSIELNYDNYEGNFDNYYVEENSTVLYNASKKGLKDDTTSLSDSETEASNKYKKMRYTSSNTNELLELPNEFDQVESVIVFDVITNQCDNDSNSTDRPITRHNSEGNFDRIINLQNKKKSSKKLGKSSNSMFKLDNGRKHDKSLRSRTKSGFLNGVSKSKAQHKQKSLHKFDSEKCIANNENGDSQKHVKNSKKKFKSNSFVDKYDFYDGFKISDNDDSCESEDEIKNENSLSFLKNYTCNDIENYMTEQLEELLQIETFQSKVIIHDDNFDNIFNENQALLKRAYEFCHAKIYVPTYVRAQYCECEMISYYNAAEENYQLESGDFEKHNEDLIKFPETIADETFTTNIVNSTDDEDDSFEITIMTEIGNISDLESVKCNQFEFLKPTNYTMVPENSMEYTCEAEPITIDNIFNDESKVNVFNNNILDECVSNQETNNAFILKSFNKIHNIDAIEKHLNDKIQVNEVLTLLCENAVMNSNQSNIDQVPDVPEENVMESEDLIHLDETIEQISYNENIEIEADKRERKDSTFSYLVDSRKSSLTKINEINENFDELLPVMNVSIKNSKNENELKSQDSNSDRINQEKEKTKRKQIEIKLNILNTNLDDEMTPESTADNHTKNENDENCLVINFDLDFAKFPGFRIGKSVKQQNGNNTQLSLFCEYASPSETLDLQTNENDNLSSKSNSCNSLFESLKQESIECIQTQTPILNNYTIIPEIIITDNEAPIDIKDLIINGYAQHVNDSGIENSLLVDDIIYGDKNMQEMEEVIENEKNEAEDECEDVESVANEYSVNSKTLANVRQRPSYLIEKNTHIFGGVDEDEDDEFFISSGAVYQSWPYIYEPGFKLIPIIELEEINHVLSKSDNFVFCYSNDKDKNNSSENLDDINDNDELANYELPSYSLKNYGINLIHIDEKKSKKKKRRRIRSRSIDDLQDAGRNENCYFSNSSFSDDSDSDLYDDSSEDDSQSIREYEQRHALGFNRNLNCIALNGNNKVCSHLDLLYENQNAFYMNSDEQLSASNQNNVSENLKKRHSSLKLGRMANSFADDNFLMNKRALFFSANI